MLKTVERREVGEAGIQVGRRRKGIREESLSNIVFPENSRKCRKRPAKSRNEFIDRKPAKD